MIDFYITESDITSVTHLTLALEKSNKKLIKVKAAVSGFKLNKRKLVIDNLIDLKEEKGVYFKADLFEDVEDLLCEYEDTKVKIPLVLDMILSNEELFIVDIQTYSDYEAIHETRGKLNAAWILLLTVIIIMILIMWLCQTSNTHQPNF